MSASVQSLKSAILAIRTIEEHLASLDPYNCDFPDPNESFSIRDCEFPSNVENPFTLIRTLRGEQFAARLEYEDNLESILYVLSDCVRDELISQGVCDTDGGFSDSQEEEQTGSAQVQGAALGVRAAP